MHLYITDFKFASISSKYIVLLFTSVVYYLIIGSKWFLYINVITNKRMPDINMTQKFRLIINTNLDSHMRLSIDKG